MSHTFLSLDMSLIPQETKDNVPTFNSCLFSNDMTRLLLDGRSISGQLVHAMPVLLSWVRWSDNQQEAVDLILSSAIEYTAEEFISLKENPDSIWYVSNRDLN